MFLERLIFHRLTVVALAGALLPYGVIVPVEIDALERGPWVSFEQWAPAQVVLDLQPPAPGGSMMISLHQGQRRTYDT